MLILLQGPAGAAKSQHARALLADGQVDVIADLTQLHVALKALERDPATGKYPVRKADDKALALAAYLRRTTVRQALRTGLNVVVTSGTPGLEGEYEAIAREAGTTFQVMTDDPGRSVVSERLAGAGGTLSDECQNALNRWYGA